MTTWLHWLLLFAAGGGGVCLRWLLTQRIDAGAPGFAHPGVLVVNLAGCLAIGALAAALPVGPARTIAVAGLLGGFTTYSSFALLTVELGQAHRWGPLAWQLGGHVLGGVLMVVLGAALVGLVGRSS